MCQLIWSQSCVMIEALGFKKVRAKASAQLVLHIGLPDASSRFCWVYIIWNGLHCIKSFGLRCVVSWLQQYILLCRFASSHQVEVRIHKLWVLILVPKWIRTIAPLLAPKLQTISILLLVKLLILQYSRQTWELRLNSKLRRIELLTL